ncbi:hypothetical protein PRIPAC_89704 [Pristionchus pacificus]|uniref:Uncharacterized protein n=1 Tax=Pristionchus pacificus TaxID=54126 RepID=A0A2A6CXH1_PRIPA|nr:hypothetical protein PRIPAC_89704 [Pristionchus pacificus]|eukprot:PDM82721.1 hypothetical protein PRIPAC_37114 [Pristionchus pacificus]
MRQFLRFLVLVLSLSLVFNPAAALEGSGKEGCASDLLMQAPRTEPTNPDVCRTAAVVRATGYCSAGTDPRTALFKFGANHTIFLVASGSISDDDEIQLLLPPPSSFYTLPRNLSHSARKT